MPTATEAQLRHSKCYARVLKEADERYMQGGLAVYDGLSLLDFDRANIERGQAWAVANLNHESETASLCLEYALGGRHILGIRRQTELLIQWLRTGLLAARKLGDKLSEEDCYTGLGLAYCRLGDTLVGIEHHNEALAIARAINDQGGEAIALGNLGIANENLGEYAHALQCHADALKLDRENRKPAK